MQESSSAAASPSPAPGNQGVELDPEQLSPGALRGLIEEFVTREGTDYGSGHALDRNALAPEWSLEDKVAEVYRQLSSGEARIVFDLESESASIISARALAEGIAAGPTRPRA